MILANISDANAYRGIHPRLDRVIDCLNDAFLDAVGTETQKLEGDRLYVTRFNYETLPRDDTFFEAHRQYLDVHLMASGEERVEIASPNGLTLFEHKDDFYAYRGEAQHSFVLRPGMFLVVFPDDAHRIKMQVNGPERVSKIVFKLSVYET